MNQGQLLKKIRLSRKVNQQQLSQGISSQSSLSRIEKNGHIDSDILLQYLNRLDIQPTEFFMLVNPKGFKEAQNYSQKQYKAYYNQAENQKLIQHELILYDKTKIIKHRINALCIRVVYAKIHNITLNDQDEIVEEIQKYLFAFETWLLSDILLYLDVLFLFDDSFIRSYHNRMVRSLENLPISSVHKHHLQIAYAHNNTVLSFERGNLIDVKFYLQTFKKFLSSPTKTLTDTIYYQTYSNLLTLEQSFDQQLYNQTIDDLSVFKKFGHHQEYENIFGFIKYELNKNIS